MEKTELSPSTPLPGNTVTSLTPIIVVPCHEGISSKVPSPPATAWRCRNGTSAPATNASRNAAINRGNPSAARVRAWSIITGASGWGMAGLLVCRQDTAMPPTERGDKWISH